MRKLVKLGSALLILALFAGCKGKTTTKSNTTTKVQPTSDNSSSSKTKVTTSNRSTTKETSTKESGEQEYHFLTISLDTSADTSTLKNTIKVFNTTTNAELENGSGFKEDDLIKITVFNCASDVKFRVVRLTDPEYDIYPLVGLDQLTGSEVSTGQEPIEINAPAANLKIEVVVDDGSETYEYGKIYFHNTASNVTFEATRLDEDGITDIKLNNGDTIIVNETIWIDVKNNGSSDIMVTEYIDGEFLETTKITSGRNERVFFSGGKVTDVYFEPYTTCTISASSLPIGTSLTAYNEETDSVLPYDSQIDKYTMFKVFVSNNGSSTKKIFEIKAGDVVLYSELISGNSTAWFNGYILTDDVTFYLSEIEGPTITHPGMNIDAGYWVSAYYIYGPNEEDIESLDSGDKIPTGYKFGFTIYIFADDPSETITLTISMGGETIKTVVVPWVEDGYTLVDDAFVATDNIVVTVA